MAAHIEIGVEALVVEIANLPDGEVCFLCLTSSGTGCIWNKIGEDITSHGHAHHVINFEDVECMHTPPLSLAEFYKACHYTCYRHYIFMVSNWTRGMGRIWIPACIEACIWLALPGDGVFVGFKDNQECSSG